MKIDAFQAKGQRPYMEDFMLTTDISRGTLLGVFDGHGGSDCAQWLHDNTIDVVEKHLLTLGDPQEALRYAVEYLAKSTAQYYDGSTLSLAFIPNYTGKAEVYTAQIGDSPIIVRTANGTINTGSDHNVRSNYVEADLARTRGGFVSGGYLFRSYDGPGLQLSRALGDSELASVLSRQPDLRYFELGDGSFILMASDGLFTGHDQASIGDVVLPVYNLETTAESLVNAALAVPTRDNVTAIIVRF